jgi:hypothetical protein
MNLKRGEEKNPRYTQWPGQMALSTSSRQQGRGKCSPWWDTDFSLWTVSTWISFMLEAGGRRQSRAATELLTEKRQNGRQNGIFWRHVRSSKRFGGCFCRNNVNLKNLIYKSFVRNLTSKLARSTLTSASRIRIKQWSPWSSCYSSV